MTPEGKVKKRVKEILTEAGAYYHMSVPTGYGTPTLDFLVCYYGCFIAIEAKVPSEKPTLRQKATIKGIFTAKGKTLVEDGRDDCRALRELLSWVKHTYKQCHAV